MNDPIPLHVAPPPASETEPGPGPGPGARLQAARQERGLDLAVAAQALHVAPRIIEAIEADRYEVFDAPVYARGFLRAYARLLNVPADEVLGRYDALTPDPPAPTLIPPANAGRLPRDWSGLRKVAVLVLALAAVGTSYWWWMGRVAPTEPATSAAVAPATTQPIAEGEGETSLGVPTTDSLAAGEGADLSAAPAPAAAPSPTAVAPSAAAPLPKATTSSAAPAAGPATSPAMAAANGSPPKSAAPAPARPAAAPLPTPAATGTAAPASAPGSSRPAAAAGLAPPPLIAPVADGPQIVLRGKKDCWVEVRAAGGARLFYGLVRPGETHTMPGPAPWFVYLGYADGIEVTVGGRVVDIPSSRREGVKARFSLAADGTPR